MEIDLAWDVDCCRCDILLVLGLLRLHLAQAMELFTLTSTGNFCLFIPCCAPYSLCVCVCVFVYECVSMGMQCHSSPRKSEDRQPLGVGPSIRLFAVAHIRLDLISTDSPFSASHFPAGFFARITNTWAAVLGFGVGSGDLNAGFQACVM